MGVSFPHPRFRFSLVQHSLTAYVLGGSAALLMGLAKTGLPGVAIPAVLLMVEAFPDDAKASVGAIMPAILLGDVIAVAWFHRHADWPRLWGMVPYVAAGMALGALVLAGTKGNELRPILGWLVATFLIVEVCRQCFHWEAVPGQWWFAAAVGLVAGFGTMVGNAAGPVMTIYLISRGLRKKEFIGTCAWFFFIVNLSKLPIMYGLGMLNVDTVGFGLIVACLAPVGAILGIWLLKIIPQRPFDVLALSLAGLAAIRLIAA
jgi:hypothetical protein